MLWSSIYHTIIFAKGYKHEEQCFRNLGNQRINQKFSLVIPAKNEPIDLIRNCLSSIRKSSVSVKELSIETVLVLDDPLRRSSMVLNSVKEILDGNTVVVFRVNIANGRNGALNDGVKFSLSDAILIMDIDSIISREIIEEASKCQDVCVFRWKTYTNRNTFIEEAVAFITDFGSWIYYKLRSCANFFVYPLGAGTFLSKKIIKRLGFWPIHIIQDDIWLGVELARYGIRPKLGISRLMVGVPETLRAFRIQQCRWAFGTSEVLSRFAKDLIKSPMDMPSKLEALLYILQPLYSCPAFIGFIIAPIAGYLESTHLLQFLPLILIIVLSMVLEAMIMKIFVEDEKIYNRKALFLMGRTSALMTLLTPLIAVYAIAGILRKRIPYRITPKGEGKQYVDVSIYLMLSLGILTFVLSTLSGNHVVLLLGLSELIVAIYSLVRFS